MNRNYIDVQSFLISREIDIREVPRKLFWEI